MVQSGSSFLLKLQALNLTILQGLEDAFDGANRQNLRHFIWREDKFSVGEVEDSQEIAEQVKEEVSEPTYYYLPTQSFSSKDEGLEIEKRELTRIPTMAIFHKFTVGRGVPHTFVGRSYTH